MENSIKFSSPSKNVKRMVEILVVEDNLTYQLNLLHLLDKFFVTKAVSTLHGAISAFASKEFGAALMDLELPDSQTDKTVAAMKKAHPGCAIIVLSGNEDPKQIRRSILQSASNYLIKGRDDQDAEKLAKAISEAINNNEAIQKANHTLEHINNQQP
jgi:DNA-binding NarL/FixJ family response regulator